MDAIAFSNLATFFLIFVVILTLLSMLINPKKAASRKLSKKAVALGNIKGRSKAEILSMLGKPNITQAVGDLMHYTWDAGHYSITLGFNKEDECIGVLGEVNSL